LLNLLGITSRYTYVFQVQKNDLTSFSKGWISFRSAIAVIRRGRQFIRPLFVDAFFLHAQLLASHAQS